MALPDDVLTLWHRQSATISSVLGSHDNNDEIDKLMEFLKLEVERILNNRHQSEVVGRGLQGQVEVPTAQTLISRSGATSEKVCIFCPDFKNHYTNACRRAKKLTLEERMKRVKETKACFRCLRVDSHRAQYCKFAVPCTSCSGRHHNLLCNRKESEHKNTTVAVEKVNTCQVVTRDNIYLQTIMIAVKGSLGWHKARCLLDSGSQKTYISSALVKKLALTSVAKVRIKQGVFGGHESTPKVVHVFEVPVSAAQSGTQKWSVRVLEAPIICQDVPKISDSLFNELKGENIHISDFNSESKGIDILIGADYYGKLMTGNKYNTDLGPIAIETLLGWTVVGGYSNCDYVVNNLIISSLCLNNSVNWLWSLDTLGITDPAVQATKAEVNKNLLNELQQNIQFADGRYCVNLPWKDGRFISKHNKELALSRLHCLTKRLKKSGFFEVYNETLKEWIKDGVIEEAPKIAGELTYYLPHREVVKKNNSSFKVRPVFDGSAKAKNSVNPSLNECLEKGPNLIEAIPTILTRFRMDAVGVAADIRRAFLQIVIAEEDRDFLRFLWWDGDNIVEFRHKRVVFGLTSSPFHLGAVINFHLSQVADFKDTAKIMNKSFYVDDCISSLPNHRALKKFKEEAQVIMERASMELVGWSYTLSDMEKHKTDIDMSTVVTSVLGMRWNTYTDRMAYNLNFTAFTGPVTKRTLLAKSQRVFDPLGLLAPCMIHVKILIQQVWLTKLNWDEPISEHLANKCKLWFDEMHQLSQLEFPRWLGFGAGVGSSSIHVFCDASKDAYATAIFLRCEFDEKVTVQLVQAKSRVSPINDKITIPRLELLAACLGARLYSDLVKGLEWEMIPVHFWTDSSVVLAWLQKPNVWKTFVSNRVNEILMLTDVHRWNHIPGECNPADLPSRGCGAQHLIEGRWWEGPRWLRQQPSTWPKSVSLENVPEIKDEEKPTSVHSLFSNIVGEEFIDRFNYFSRFSKNVRMVAYMFRFFTQAAKSTQFNSLVLDTHELLRAETFIFKLMQRRLTEKYFKIVNSTLDDNGIWRVKTRVLNNIDFDKNPILLPGKNVLVKRLIREEHLNNNHAGVLTLLTMLRKRFWITVGRRAVKSIVTSCMRCQRFRSKSACPPIPPLPLERTVTAKIFQTIGVDAFGPLYLTGKKKVWGIIFTCCVYRAIHLELVESMTTSSFIMSFRRFIARRGKVDVVISDNGGNFLGASQLLSDIDPVKFNEFANTQKIKWKHNPPLFPWYGGFFERLIRCVKDVLKRVLGKAVLTLEELSTTFCEAEATINARPITYVSEDATELQPISPSYFLQEITEFQVPEFDFIDKHFLTHRAKYVAKVREDLKNRFKNEYLSLLAEKGKRQLKALSVGDVVLVGSDDKKRIDWPLGLITELLPGRDGFFRVARLKVGMSIILRPLQRLYPLELNNPPNIMLNDISANEISLENVSESNLSCEQLDDKCVESFNMNDCVTRAGRKVIKPVKLDL